MSLLSVVNDVCGMVGVHATTSVFANINANRTMFEMLAVANETAQATAFDAGHDWTILQQPAELDPSMATLIEFGQARFNLPANFKRLLLTTSVRRKSTPRTAMRFIPDQDEWVTRRYAGDSDSRGEWTLVSQYFLVVVPVPAASDRIFFPYFMKNCVILSGGGFGERFQNDDDRFILDERLLKLGMIWKWKALKGSPYAEDLGTYQDALTMAMGKDRPSPIIVDRMPISAAARVAYPWPVPT